MHMGTQHTISVPGISWFLRLIIVLGVIFLILLLAGALAAIGVVFWSIWTLPFVVLAETTVRVALTLLIVYGVYRICAPLAPSFRFRFW